MYVIRIYIFVTAMLWGKTSRPAPRVSTLVPFILLVVPVMRHLSTCSSNFFQYKCLLLSCSYVHFDCYETRLMLDFRCYGEDISKCYYTDHIVYTLHKLFGR